MTWSIFAVLGAFIDATYNTIIKINLQHVNQFVLSTSVFLTTSFLLFIVSGFRGFSEIGPRFYPSGQPRGT